MKKSYYSVFKKFNKTRAGYFCFCSFAAVMILCVAFIHVFSFMCVNTHAEELSDDEQPDLSLIYLDDHDEMVNEEPVISETYDTSEAEQENIDDTFQTESETTEMLTTDLYEEDITDDDITEENITEEVSTEELTEEITEEITEEESADISEPEEETEAETTEEPAAAEETDIDDDDEIFIEPQAAWSGNVQSEAEFEAQLMQFPQSYWAGLRAVHSVYPNYRFTADYVGMDYEAVVDAEVGKKVSSGSAYSWRAMYDSSFGYYENYDWDTGEWYYSEGAFTYTSREVIEYFMDPRNFLDTSNIYMFMKMSYSPDQSIDDLRSMIAGSFLAAGYSPKAKDADDVRLKGDYAAVLMEAAQISGISPFVLAASIIIEHGYSGETPLISGKYVAKDGTKYKGYYNFYDIGATGSDSDNVIQNGLEYAKAQGWTSRYKSIVYGAVWNSDGYIKKGQDTYYYREYNVINGWDALWHQYSTAVMTAYSSAAMMRSALAGNTYAALEFRIPVYDNMPDSAVPEPDYNSDLNNYYFTDMQAKELSPAFTMANHEYTMSVTSNSTISVCVPKWATYESAKKFTLNKGENIVELNVRSQTGFLRTYRITVMASKKCMLTVDTYEGNHLSIKDDPVYVWGDANGDGKVSALDYITIKNHIMETKLITDESLLLAADTNDDGKVSALDYIAIKNYIMSK